MNNADAASLIEKVKKAAWFPLLQKTYSYREDANTLLNSMIDALAIFEQSAESSPVTERGLAAGGNKSSRLAGWF